MDFTNVINAIDRLVKNRVGAAAYTRMFIAVVQGVEDTETNTYKISYDGGKTSVTAITITPDVNETIYKKGDSVQVLQLNGDGNTNLYILGKDSDISQKNIDELDNHFIEKNKYLVKDTLEFKLNDGSNIVETIKSFGSFIIGATFSVDNLGKIYNYGIKINLDFGQKGITTYVFDTYQMLGQPWNYKGIQQKFKQKIDEFYCPYLEKITLEKFIAAGHEAQTEIKDIEISSALLHEANVYTAEFKGSKTGLDFITEKQAGKNNTALQVLFYKNNVFFASEKCKYYWFRRDESVDSGNEHYHQYGGKGWYLLNSTETQTSLDGNKEITETIVKNNIGSSLQISNEVANQYHNYFKCVVEYGMHTAATEEKEILNLDRTALSFSLTTDNSVITKLDENTVLNIKLDLNDSDNQVNLIKWSYQKDNTGSREYIIDKGIEKELNLANAASTEATRKISNILGLQHTTFYCTLINTSITPITTLGEAKLTITRDLSTELTEEIWYCDNEGKIAPPESVDTNAANWTTDLLKLEPIDSKYIFAASRMVSPTYKGPFGDIYCYSAHGTGAAAAQLTEFNRLTNNGEDKGLYYSKDGKDKLYINADYINTGTLRVGEQNKEIFYASINNKDVKIGGFTVGGTDLSWDGSKEGKEGYVYLGQDGLKLGSSFNIDQKGNVSWNSNNSPIKQIYCVNNNTVLPANKDAYNGLPDSSENDDNAWHKIKSDKDKYYAQSSDGGATWAGPFLIQGEKGEDGTSIKSIKNSYLATEGQTTPKDDDSGWTDSIDSTTFNETNKYLWIKQVTTFNNTTTPSQTLKYITAVYGQKGNDGTSVKIKANEKDCTDIGDAYIDADGNLQVFTGLNEANEKIFTNAGKIKGPAGADGTGISLEREYLLTETNNKTPSGTELNWEKNKDKTPLSAAWPFLWCKDRYYKINTEGQAVGLISTLIYLLESLPVRTYIKYADMTKLKFDSTTGEVKPTGTTVTMTDIPNVNSGWMGTYSGYEQPAPDNYEKYKWTYYLAEINRVNFMANVLDKEKNDGIYTYKGEDNNNYIGINASAINTGSLKVTDGTDTIFNANITKNKVDIAGWNISKNQISKNGIVGMCSGNENTEVSLVEENKSSPIRFYTGGAYKKDFITSIQLGYKNDDGNVTWDAVPLPEIGYFNYTIENNKIKFDKQVNPGGGPLTNVKINNLEVNYSYNYFGDRILYLGLDEFISVFPEFITSSISTSKFKVLEDGSLYASAASIEGNINATSGSIGGFTIVGEELRGENEDSKVLFRPRATGDKTAVLEHTAESSGTTSTGKPGTAISSVTIEADDLICFKKYIKENSGIDYASLTIGSMSIDLGSSRWIYKNIIKATQGNLELGVASGYSGTLSGTWSKDTSGITTSSRNKKHDIEELDNRYSTLLDNLKPVRFKYNNGVSNRYHTGLILDEMKDAMDTAQIDSSEFAAYCVQDEKTGDGGIRYEELIALLIKEVQSLKTQVNVLTEKLNKLEEK